MLDRFREFIKNNVFAIALWTGIGALLLLSTHRNEPVQTLGGYTGGGGSGPEGNAFCNIVEDIDDYFCGDDALPPVAQGATNVRFEPNVGQGKKATLLSRTGAGNRYCFRKPRRASS